MLRHSQALAERAVHLQARRRQAKHRACRSGQVRRVREPGSMGCARQRLALHQKRPDVQEPSPQQVRPQGHAGLLHEEVPKAPRRQVRGLSNLGQQDGSAHPLADVFNSLQYAPVRWLAQGGARNVLHEFEANSFDRVVALLSAPGPVQAPGSPCNQVGIEDLKPALQP